MMSLIALKADYIYKANSIYHKLEEFEDLFNKEALILNYAKCSLMKEDNLSDFYISGISVEVFDSKNGYDLYFLNYVMEIEVYEKQIIDFTVKNMN